MKSLLGSHPFSTLVGIVVILLAIRVVISFFRGKKSGSELADGGISDALFSGVLFVNALAHFTHGISGENFAAPFGYIFGPGLLSNLLNVVWGFINIVLGYSLLVTGRVFGSDKRRMYAFFIGVLCMGIFLACVFS